MVKQEVWAIANENGKLEGEIIDKYTNQGYTLRHLSEIFNTNHHTIKRVLVRNGVAITRRKTRKPFSEENRARLSEMGKGRTSWCKGLKMAESTNRKNLISHLLVKIGLSDIEKFENFDKLKLLTRTISRNIKFFNTKVKYLGFLNRFYFCEQFNQIYER